MSVSRPASRVARGCCWISTARYERPLDPGSAKKWGALATMGREMYVVGVAAKGGFRQFHEHATFVLVPDWRIRLLRILAFALVAWCAAAYWAIRGRVGVVVAQGPPEAVIATMVKFAARVAGRRVVLVVESHGDFELGGAYYAPSRLRAFVDRLGAALARAALRRADGLRAISRATREQLVRHAPGKPVEQFMTWTDIDVFTAARRSRPPSACDEVVYAGVLVPGKGVHWLLDAFSRVAHLHPGARLRIIGAAQHPEYAAALEAAARNAGLDHRVHFTGPVDRPTLAGFFVNARVVVLPSRAEGLGRVLVEAMSCGTPAIGSDVGGIPDVITPGVTGWLVPVGDVDALAAAVEAAMRPEVDQLGDAARQVAVRLHSTAGYAESYGRLIDRACAAAGSRHPEGAP